MLLLQALTLLGPSTRAEQEREALALELATLVRDTCDGPAAILHHLVRTRYGDSPVLQRVGACLPEPVDEASAYERRRALILAAYKEVEGDVRRLEALLRSRGLPCSRKWLTIYLERWGARAMRFRSRCPAGPAGPRAPATGRCRSRGCSTCCRRSRA